MAGIYIHIPFCKQKCSYCDFHFSTSLKNKDALIKPLVKEIELKSTLINEPVSTIYFGGGTPSLMNNDELIMIIEAIQKSYSVSKDVEFTVECNPDDLSKQKLVELKNVGVNRLSIGTQSFFNDDLKFFNRAHLSAYSLTVEPKTALSHQVKTNKIKLLPDDTVLQQFTTLMDFASNNNMIHYEISNFAKEGFFSQHNSNYWKGVQY